MKSKTLQKLNVTNIRTLLLVFLLSLFTGLIHAQPQPYQSSGGILVGTSDSRLFSSVYETETSVVLKVMAIGYMHVDYIAFPFFYDPNYLQLSKANGEAVTQYGYLHTTLGQGVATLNDDLAEKEWICSVTHKDAGVISLPNFSGHASMRAVMFDLVGPSIFEKDNFKVNEGEVKTVFECYFIKKTSGNLLTNDNIGIGVKTTPLFYQPKLGNDGLFLWYRELENKMNSSDNREINSNLFLYRSGSYIITNPVSEISTTSAMLNGFFREGAINLQPSTTMLDTTGTLMNGTGRLNYDTVGFYGFIYASTDVNISISEFSDSIIVNGITYSVPTASEIAAGTFTRGGYIFYIVPVNNNNGVETQLDYDTMLTGLTPNQKYYAWAYSHYKFETSNTYQAVGDRVEFTTENCIALNVGAVFSKLEPLCGASNGEIQVHVIGGSGVYEFSINGGTYTIYENDVITGLSAGVYTIMVRDTMQRSCPASSIGNIILHNGNTDLSVSLTPEDATNCELKDGTLLVSVTGGKMPYSYSLNGSMPEINNGVIANLKADVYELIVTDALGCVASSGEVRIAPAAPSFTATVNVTQHATCGSSTGAITVTVDNAASYTYQLDGYPEELGTATTIELTGLSAGIHYLRIADDCGETVTEFEITNGRNTLSFTATPENEILSCDGHLLPGSITLKVNYGAGQLEYSIDGENWKQITGSTAVIAGLHYGLHRVEVRDGAGCTYEVNHVMIERETSYGTLVTPPVATTPQSFCSSATVGNLQATGTGINWYLTAEGGEALSMSTPLDSGVIYYAAQSVGLCESQKRTAVKVYINDNVTMESPKISTPQQFCNASNSLTLSDIATDGNTNIVWYDVALGGTPLPLSTLLQAQTYYAALQAGVCQSAPRTPIVITFGTTNPAAPEMKSPQYFCEGAIIANLAVPHNKIKWYSGAMGGELLPANNPLQDNMVYYASQDAGECESETRTAVTVYLTYPEAPIALETQPVCGKVTLADLEITGSGIVWYGVETQGTPLPLTTELVNGVSYWAAQSSGDCEGARVKITITDACYVVYGTMFPFVYTGDEEFDGKFPVTVRLLPLPEKDGSDPVQATLNATPIQVVTATYYDGSVYIPETPKYPGMIGNTNNPGLPINWEELGKTVGAVNNTAITGLGDIPVTPVGMFTFKNITPGKYILEISRQGYLIRLGKVTIDADGMSLGHRELIAGDVNNDFTIDGADISNIKPNFFDATNGVFAPQYDLNGDGNVNIDDRQIIINNMNANIYTYLETIQWIMSFYE